MSFQTLSRKMAPWVIGLTLSFTMTRPVALAHELQDNRATLVLREQNHISITLYVAYTEALRLALAPQQPQLAFLLELSAMKPEALGQELQRAQAKFQKSTRLFAISGSDPAPKEIPLINWVWPDAQRVQSVLQQRVMQSMVDAQGHSHEIPLEIHADVNTAQEIHSVRIQFPEEFQKVLVVSYRPSQTWVDRNSLSANIAF